MNLIDHLQGKSPWGSKRSSKWPKTRAAHLKEHPTCEACGKKENLEVHHRHPFHLFPEKELSSENLITLCEGKTANCHFVFGHCFLSWKCYNPNVAEDVQTIGRMRKCSKTQ